MQPESPQWGSFRMGLKVACCRWKSGQCTQFGYCSLKAEPSSTDHKWVNTASRDIPVQFHLWIYEMVPKGVL